MIINWGDAPFKAFITVTYPSGTCTVSLGNKSFTHSGGGTHTFTVNKKGTWTVTGTDGNGVDTSQNVVISKQQETKTVTLKYVLYIVNGAVLHSACGGIARQGVVTNKYEEAWTPTVTTGSGYTKITNGSGWQSGGYPAGVAYTSNAIDLAGYNRLIISASVTYGRDNSKIYSGVLSSKPTSSSCNFSVSHGPSWGSGATLDISNLNGKFHICLMRGYSPGSITINNMRIES